MSNVQNPADAAVLIEPRGTRQPLNVIGDTVTVLLSAADGAAMELFEVSGPEGSGPPPHQHPWEESYYVTSGTISITAGDRQALVGPGDVVHVPGGVLHQFRMESSDACMLVMTNPGGAARFFTEVDAEVGPMPESFPALVEVARRNGLWSPLFEG